MKSAFNAGQVLIAAGLGLAVSRSIAVPSDPLAAGQLAAMAAGVGAYVLVNTVLIAGDHRVDGHPLERVRERPPDPVTLAGAGVTSA